MRLSWVSDGSWLTHGLAGTCKTRQALRPHCSDGLIGTPSHQIHCKIARRLTRLVRGTMNGSQMKPGPIAVASTTGNTCRHLCSQSPKGRKHLPTQLLGTWPRREVVLLFRDICCRASSSVGRCGCLSLGRHLLRRRRR